MPLVSKILSEAASPDALWQDPVPVQDVQSEKPWHRVAIMLAAQGCTVTEIASKLERTVSWVSLLLRQPWARERLTKKINESGRDEIATMLKSAGADALRRVLAISEQAENESVKLAANREILDRLLGKPVQHVEQKSEVRLDMEKIEAELRVLEEQEKQLLGARGEPSGSTFKSTNQEDCEKPSTRNKEESMRV